MFSKGTMKSRESNWCFHSPQSFCLQNYSLTLVWKINSMFEQFPDSNINRIILFCNKQTFKSFWYDKSICNFYLQRREGSYALKKGRKNREICKRSVLRHDRDLHMKIIFLDGSGVVEVEEKWVGVKNGNFWGNFELFK